MIGWKGIYAVIAVVVYSVLIGLFVKFSADILQEKCTIEHPCVSFCSEDVENESNEVLKDKFHEANLDRYIKNEFEILRGEPKCREDMVIKEPKSEGFEFAPVRIFFKEI